MQKQKITLLILLICFISKGYCNSKNTNNGRIEAGLSNASDLIAVPASEATFISSLINTNAPLAFNTGIQVWQFKIRDGGASLSDADNLPTILTDFTIAQSVGNQVSVWTDAINSIAFFDGNTFVASGNVTSNQIQFSGINITVPDNTEKIITLRLSLKCPLGVGIKDGEDFGFSISNLNTTFSPLGSGKSSFAALTSANGKNVIDVVATQLAFTTQPITTGVNNVMDSVIISAVDACGNTDLDFTGTISLSSSGTMNYLLPINAVMGSVTFNTIFHTVAENNVKLMAVSGLISGVSSFFDIIQTTIFKEGDFAVIGFNSDISCLGTSYSVGDDEVSFITFKDIKNGDTFYITDNGYERVTAGLWGDTEGVYKITRNGATLPVGSIITFKFLQSSPYMEFESSDNFWLFSKVNGFSNTITLGAGGDQLLFMQGGIWNNPSGSQDATYNYGNFIYGFNTKTSWNSLVSSTQESGIPKELKCINFTPSGASNFMEYTGPTTAGTKYEWLSRILNSTNWVSRANCSTYTGIHRSKFYPVLSDSFTEGVWTGAKSTDWFDCSNWQTMVVPKESTDVELNSTYATKNAVIDVISNSANAQLFGNFAKCKKLTISDKAVKLESNTSNVMDVFGDLNINSSGVLEMLGGQLNLHGNWTNNVGDNAFLEENGTVKFSGTTSQIISSVSAEGTEKFNNVILDNNFETAISNDLIATGDLTVNLGKKVIIDSNGFIQVNRKLNHNGEITIENNGQLIQVDDIDLNDGDFTSTQSKFSIKRNYTAKNLDYIYWSSPVKDFNVSNLPSNNRYEWNPVFLNSNGTQGKWVSANGFMTKGKGYIARISNNSNVGITATHIFNGKPNNGTIYCTIERGNFDGPDYDADITDPNNALTSKYDDNWNLIGNPYPSAIDAEKFLVLNQSKIEGAVWLWKHQLDPIFSISPFYSNYTYNYSSSDYVVYNGLGSTEPNTFQGKIASGQGFMVNMLHSESTPGTVVFNNSLRQESGYVLNDNSNFLKTKNNDESKKDKSRIWLAIVNDISGQSNNTLIGYTSNATMGKDYLYDCPMVLSSELSIYSFIEEEPYIIQGRPLPFDVRDNIRIGVNLDDNGKYAVAIEKLDGIFSQNQDVYLKDNLLNIIHDLKDTPYHFYSEKGRVDSRFELVFSDDFLKVNKVEDTKDKVLVNLYNNELTIKSLTENIKEVVIYDLLGRKLFETKDIGRNLYSTELFFQKQQSLIIGIKLENEFILTKKIFFE